MIEVALAWLGSAAISAGIAAALVWLSKAWITERLRNAIAHEYAEKLETHKAQLLAENAVALERLRADNERERAVQAIATATFAASHNAAHQRRLDAIDTLWKAIIRIERTEPPALLSADIITEEEYPLFLTKASLRENVQAISMETIAKTLDDATRDAELARPFFGNYLYALLFAYRAFVGRVSFVLMNGFQTGNMIYWKRDPGVQGLLAATFTEEEKTYIAGLVVGGIAAVKRIVEQKMLLHINSVISGEESGNLGLQQAQAIMEASANVLGPGAMTPAALNKKGP